MTVMVSTYVIFSSDDGGDYLNFVSFEYWRD